MEDIIYCGIDYHKNNSVLYAATEKGVEIEKITIKSALLAQYFGNRRNWKLAIESSCGVNNVTMKLKALGIDVTIVNSNQFRGIGISGKKTDERDAKALCNALRLNAIPGVHLKSLRSRQIKSLMVLRENIVQSRVSATNSIRGLLREYGLPMPVGVKEFFENVEAELEKLDCDEIKISVKTYLANIRLNKNLEKEMEERIKLLMQGDDKFKRLQTVPGIGPLGATALIITVDDIKRFKNAREFSSYLGLVPTVTASANMRMMGSITRSGSEMTRRYLIHGARAAMRYAPTPADATRTWAEQVKERRGMNKAVVALAHRMARIAFAILRDGSTYRGRLKGRRNKKEIPELATPETGVAVKIAA
jgi:transposase